MMDYSLLIGVHDKEKADDALENFILTKPEGGGKKNSTSDENRPDSDHDNFSPTEDTEDTDDDQLNCKYKFILFLCSLRKMLNLENFKIQPVSGQTPPESPVSKLTHGIFGIASAEPKQEIYFMALIDILTHYGLKKRSANVAKTVKYGADGEISTVKPEQYSKRFLDFINKILE